jgi:hypothetical protein
MLAATSKLHATQAMLQQRSHTKIAAVTGSPHKLQVPIYSAMASASIQAEQFFNAMPADHVLKISWITTAKIQVAP